MNDDYLWDGSGEPDPEVQRLESVLGKFRHNRPAPQLPEPARSRWHLAWAQAVRPYLWPQLAAAAALVVVVAGTWLAVRRLKHAEIGRNRGVPKSASEQIGEYSAEVQVARLGGAPNVGSELIRQTGHLGVGEWLETDPSSRATIRLGRVGQVEVEPNTRLRLVQASLAEDRLALQLGTIRATIWAPPRQFFVETPSAVAVDLGCQYTLHVDDRGAGLVQVTFGWVGFELNGRESFIPAGALCATRPGIGPGTPYFEDVAPAFRAALEKLDFEKVSSEARASALGVVLGKSRRRDALTLWHLISRTSDRERSRVFQRLAAFVPPPAGVSREGVLRGDKQMLDLWWDGLGLGDTTWWREWERPWPQESR